MKRYINKSKEMRTIVFEDGETVFMFRGQVHETDKTPKEVPEGVRVSDVKPTPTRKRSKPSEEKKETDSEE